MNELRVVKLRDSTALDIPQQLRNLANDIERGILDASHVLVVVEGSPNNRPSLMQFGESRPVPHAIGVLTAAIHNWLRPCNE